MQLINSCSRPTNIKKPVPNTLDALYDKNESQQIVSDISFLNHVFEKVHLEMNVPKNHIGYFLKGDGLFFKHCLDKATYLSSDKCNIYSVLSEEEHHQFTNSINSLQINEIIGTNYSPPLDSIVFILNVPHESQSDRRFICLSEMIDTAFIKNTSLKVLDQKDGLTLLANSY